MIYVTWKCGISKVKFERGAVVFKVIVIVFMDDFLFFSLNLKKIKTVKKEFTDRYIMKDLDSCGQFTCIKIDQSDDKKITKLS